MSDDSPAAAAAAAQAAAAAAVASSSVPLVTTSQLSAHVRAVCALFWPPSATTQLVDAALARNEAPLATFIHDAKQATLVRKKKIEKKKEKTQFIFFKKKTLQFVASAPPVVHVALGDVPVADLVSFHKHIYNIQNTKLN
jgi:hypothetical protein